MSTRETDIEEREIRQQTEGNGKERKRNLGYNKHIFLPSLQCRPQCTMGSPTGVILPHLSKFFKNDAFYCNLSKLYQIQLCHENFCSLWDFWDDTYAHKNFSPSVQCNVCIITLWWNYNTISAAVVKLQSSHHSCEILSALYLGKIHRVYFRQGTRNYILKAFRFNLDGGFGLLRSRREQLKY